MVSSGTGVVVIPLAAALAAFICSGVVAASCVEIDAAAGGVVVRGGTSTAGAAPIVAFVGALASAGA